MASVAGAVLESVSRSGINIIYWRDSVIIVMLENCNYPALGLTAGTRTRSYSERERFRRWSRSRRTLVILNGILIDNTFRCEAAE